MSKTLGGEGGGADDDEGDELEEDAEDSRPLWGGQEYSEGEHPRKAVPVVCRM